jgi:hypothetical protein
MVQLPLAPNGVTSFTAPFKLKVHLDALVKAVLDSDTDAPTPASAAMVYTPFLKGWHKKRATPETEISVYGSSGSG